MTIPNWKASWLAPQLPQRQDSLEDQLRDVRELANRAGCYDAADWIASRATPDSFYVASTPSDEVVIDPAEVDEYRRQGHGVHGPYRYDDPFFRRAGWSPRKARLLRKQTNEGGA